MLKKLIKYDLFWSIKAIVIFLGLGVIFTILGMLFALIPDSLLFEVIAAICKGISVSMFANALFNSMFRSWSRNVNNLYKDESYLTHTLPIDKSTHFASKVISQVILIVVTALLLLLAIYVMYINKDVLEFLKTYFKLTSETLNTSVAGLIVVFVLLVLLEFVYIAFCGNFGIIYGHTYNNNKMLMTVLFGIAAYFVENIILLGIFLIVSIFNKDMYAMIFNQSEILNYSFLMTISYICIIVYTVSSILLYFITNKIFKKGVNVD